ncbi:hypothetical protein [Actinoplanes sp. NPDC049265]|uniref:hypothetical protein n=1 Tax=Actinoplanes sp. NPDC049265 TaxID=3363902 RepID=UPI0037139F75
MAWLADAISSTLVLASPTPTPSGSGPPSLIVIPSVLPAQTALPDVPFWERFFTSAGFGGAGALIAAIVAATIAAVQLRHAKRQQKHDRWWDTLGWVYDRSIVEADKRDALPHRVTFTVLTELAQQAESNPKDNLQAGTVASILSMFEISESDDPVKEVLDPPDASDSVEEESRDSSSGREVTDPVALDLARSLKSILGAPGWGLAEALGRAYEDAVANALRRIGAEFTDVTSAASLIDFTVRTPRGTLAVDALSTSSKLNSSRLLSHAGLLRSYLNLDPGLTGGLIVIESEMTSIAVATIQAFDDPRITVVHWKDPNDDNVLREALAQSN